MDFKCKVCKVDTPCKHSLDIIRESSFFCDEFREETYAQFLHDGDFEKFQPATTMDHNSREFLELALEAQKEYYRALWIQNRFTIYRSPQWELLDSKLFEEWKVLGRMTLRLNREDEYFKNCGEVIY